MRLNAHGVRLNAHGVRLNAHGVRMNAHGVRMNAHLSLFKNFVRIASILGPYAHRLYPHNRPTFRGRGGYALTLYNYNLFLLRHRVNWIIFEPVLVAP